jgi:hypothetical protein
LNAFSTQVTGPPFLKRFPLAEEITTGFTAGGTMNAGSELDSAVEAGSATLAAAPAIMKSRRFILGSPPLVIADYVTGLVASSGDKAEERDDRRNSIQGKLNQWQNQWIALRWSWRSGR